MPIQNWFACIVKGGTLLTDLQKNPFYASEETIFFTGMSAETTYKEFSVRIIQVLSSLIRMMDSMGEVYSVSDLTNILVVPWTPIQHFFWTLSS